MSIPRTIRRARLMVQSLERRETPANFNIANGDVAGLVAAINTSNGNNEPDTITLAVNGTYTFTTPAELTTGGSALPTIRRDVSDSNTVIINGRGSTLRRSSVGGTPNFRLMRIGTFPNLVSVTVNNVSFTDGNSGTNNGGAIELAAGDLTVNGCTFTGNLAGNGGAIYATNTTLSSRLLSINGSTFTGNQTIGGAGGAVSMLGTTDVSISDSTFSGNISALEAGALRVQTSSAMTNISRSVFASNTANGGNGGGAIFVQGTTSVTDCTIRDNTSASASGSGGGLFVQQAPGGLTITGSTISGNRVDNLTASGGGVFVQCNLIVSNSTIFGNRAGSGGGISFANGSTTGSIKHSTVAANSAYFSLATGGGIAVFGNGVLALDNTIVAGNFLEGGGAGPDIGGTVTSSGYNLIQLTSGSVINGPATGDIYNTNPNLGPLQLNGGATATCVPNAGSAVINAGDPAFLPPSATDQRGVGYPRVSGGRVDIGAIETIPPRIFSTQVNDGSAQRSRVTSLTVSFDSRVTFAGPVADAFTLVRTKGGAVSFVAVADVVNGVTIVTLSNFNGIDSQAGSLADGRYTLTAVSTKISGPGGQLDGDNNGLPGGNYTFGDAQGLFRFFGDINGDRRVDIADFGLFSLSYLNSGNYVAAFDVNGDGRIDIADFGAFSVRYLANLP